MRILPVVFYLQSIFGTDFTGIDQAYEVVHAVSSLSHAHRRSQIACGIYISVASKLMSSITLETAVRSGISGAMEYYQGTKDYVLELEHFERLNRRDFAAIPEDEVRSSGYVVDTLEAAIWCLLNTDNYRDCALKAVNLGDDTDTVAAVAGGLAGLAYGYKGIPKEWVSEIARKEYIEDLCNQLYLSLT
jgi:ADP-ribosylglycohydrolase